jgi:hypothetical protein
MDRLLEQTGGPGRYGALGWVGRSCGVVYAKRQRVDR